jgi:hypothetical protein
MTVGEVRARLRELEPDDRWRETRLDQLEPYDDDFVLVTLTEVAFGHGENRLGISPVEREAIIWQHRNNLALSEYEGKLWDALSVADDNGLNLLARAYPVKVEAIRRWRAERGFATRLRALPLAFSL